MAKSRERGTGSVYLPNDPKNPGQQLKTWWISHITSTGRHHVLLQDHGAPTMVGSLRNTLRTANTEVPHATPCPLCANGRPPPGEL
jgi:hypothetical protein